MLPILTPEQSRAWDAAAEAAGRPLRMLMETAGRAVARVVLDRHAGAASHGVLVAVGSGNNGGDGWVAARALKCLGVRVAVIEIGPPRPGIAADARRAALEDGVRLLDADRPWPGAGLVIDALLGTGASGGLREPIPSLLGRLADLAVPIVAVDGPTGLDLADGTAHDALPATTTVTFGGVRRGHLLARDATGDLVVAEIGFPSAEPGWPLLVDHPWAAAALGDFAAGAHKGDRGRLVVIGGAPGMTGAIRLTARAAFGAGAGLVHLVSAPESVSDLATAEPDAMVSGHPLAGPPEPWLVSLLERADALVIGPGLGRAPERAEFVLQVLGHVRRAVVDADALMVLASHRDALAERAATRHVVLTPHPGEFRTLFPEAADALPHDPWQAAMRAHRATGATILLKGVPTVIAGAIPAPLTVAAGNPGLATGGSGDVLSGLIGGLLGHDRPPTVAAALGAQALGDAADRAASRHGVRAMRPMDVVDALPEVWTAWRATPPLRTPELLALDRPIAG